MPTRRIAQIVHLKPSAVAAYKECHANVWPEVLQQIKDCNIRDCMSPLLLSALYTCQTIPHVEERRRNRERLFWLFWGERCQSNAAAAIDSIFFDNDRTIFATFKYVGDDFDGDMAKMKANPKVSEWWAMTDGMQVFIPLFGKLGGIRSLEGSYANGMHVYRRVLSLGL